MDFKTHKVLWEGSVELNEFMGLQCASARDTAHVPNVRHRNRTIIHFKYGSVFVYYQPVSQLDCYCDTLF